MFYILETLLVDIVKLSARQAEITQYVVDDFALCGGQAGKIRTRRDRLVGAIQTLVLFEFGGVVAEFRQTGVIGSTQRIVVHDGIEMRNRRPQAA